MGPIGPIGCPGMGVGRCRRPITQGVVIEGSIAGIEHELKECMRVWMRGARAHLHGE